MFLGVYGCVCRWTHMCAQGLLKGLFYTANVCDWLLCLEEYLYVLVDGVRGLGVYLVLRVWSAWCVCVPGQQWGREFLFLWGLSHAGWGSCVPEGEPSLSGV